MALTQTDLVDVIKALQDRIYKLELATYNYGDVTQDGRSDLNITGLGATVAYYLDGAGNQRAEVAFTWTAPAAPNPDDLGADPVVDYMFSVTRSTDTSTGQFASTLNAVSVKVSNLAVGINVTGKVYALSKSGIKGAVASYTAVVAKDTTPPPQPATPTLTAKPGGVLGTYNGLDSIGAAMPVDFAYCQVQTSTTASTGPFTTVDTVSANGTFYVLANSTYSTIYVRLLSVDRDGNINVGVPSTVVSATPLKLVSTDLGVVLPGDIGYNDTGNLIVDGSFENAQMRTNRLSTSSVGTWSFGNTAGMSDHGNWYLHVIGDATTNKYYYLHYSTVSQASEISVIPGNKLYYRVRLRGIGSNGTITLRVRFQDNTGAFQYATAASKTAAPTGGYETLEGAVIVPEGSVTAAPYLSAVNVTTGTVDFDSIQLREVLTSVLIEDAAITRVKIADAAVGSAQIEEVDAGIIKSGFIASARIAVNSIEVEKLKIGSISKMYLDDAVGSSLDLSGNSSVADKATLAQLSGVQDSVDSVTSNVTNLTNSITIDSSGINISKDGSPFQLSIDNDSLDFIDSGTVVAYVNGQKMYINTAEILQQLTVGVHVIHKYDANNTFIRWVG